MKECEEIMSTRSRSPVGSSPTRSASMRPPDDENAGLEFDDVWAILITSSVLRRLGVIVMTARKLRISISWMYTFLGGVGGVPPP